MTPDEIIGYARECIDTPFQHQGRICGVALDCAGVVCHVANQLGFEPIETPGYGRSPGLGLLEAAADAQPYLVRVFDRQPGDVLMMRFEGDPQHVGIFTGETIIHALFANRKVVEHRLDDVWEGRIVRVYRFAGVAP
ncbi:MAG: NlpC/P60 family protein [Deltaproteobacteria bacterium]|nr:NlpC/P60 family protein [Deltaproteobacteria bacterium]